MTLSRCRRPRLREQPRRHPSHPICHLGIMAGAASCSDISSPRSIPQFRLANGQARSTNRPERPLGTQQNFSQETSFPNFFPACGKLGPAPKSPSSPAIWPPSVWSGYLKFLSWSFLGVFLPHLLHLLRGLLPSSPSRRENYKGVFFSVSFPRDGRKLLSYFRPWDSVYSHYARRA